MSKILNINEETFNTIFLVPIVAVVVAVVLTFKLSVRKTEEVTKNTQHNVKKQKTTTPSKKEDKLLKNDKNEKIHKVSKKSSTSPAKSLATNFGETTTTSNKKQQPAQTEKSSNSTKKQQAVLNNKKEIAAKSKKEQTKKQIENLNNTNEEGEWQTVIAKKQKQNKIEITELFTEPAKTIEKLQKNKEQKKTSPSKQNNNKTKKRKSSTNNIEQNATSASTKTVNNLATSVIVHGEITPEEIKSTKSANVKTSEAFNTTYSDIQDNKTGDDSHSSSISAAVINKYETVKAPITQVANTTVRDNIAFDVLGDDGWTDTKPQKKNKKRALRE